MLSFVTSEVFVQLAFVTLILVAGPVVVVILAFRGGDL
ncbi:photosystem II complex subunit Ycf12 [Rubidibacter lacunae KORDI 51-2]|uniref:Photosystem II reaction center protein Psb30 n=1 Tax=Rubidibacter lacunae KORDI 51-2 TaxID=582515 RepID=U5DJB1_9CHRO|nr:photosystem II reaction center protein Ycf12 [Rubidibacter lacunae]ERN39775.1 photosystem II complex subunit Ycf12 [Rubidibacter lacunae KORDI 51-2]